jgi:hypothetical protein
MSRRISRGWADVGRPGRGATSRERFHSGPQRGMVTRTPRRPSGSASAAPVICNPAYGPSEAHRVPDSTAHTAGDGVRRVAVCRRQTSWEVRVSRQTVIVKWAAIGGAVLQLLATCLSNLPTRQAQDGAVVVFTSGIDVGRPGRGATSRERFHSGPQRGYVTRTPRRPSGSASAAPSLF